MLKLKLIFRSLTALTAGIVVGSVASSFSIRAGAEDFGAPSPSVSSVPRGEEGLFGALGPNSIPAIDEDLEVSPDDFAREYGLPLDEDSPFGNTHGLSKKVSKSRIVAPENFGDYRVNVDIFRKSTKRPVLGAFRDEYSAILVPNAEGMTEAQRTIEAKKRFADLAGREFAVASLDGVPFKAYIISAAIEQRVAMVMKDAAGQVMRDENGRALTRMSMKSTPPGNFKLEALSYPQKLRAEDGTLNSVPVAFPWIRSRTYHNSQMYWGLWIKGGYFIHSTPHYGELGRPASMGCIRQSFPDAQELFKLIVQDKLTGMIRIHAVGAKAPVSRLREIIVDLGFDAPADAPVGQAPLDPSKDMSWLLAQLQSNYQNIRDSVKYYGNEVNIVGHEWIDGETRKPTATTWPSCGDLKGSPIDCFKVWGAKKTKNSLN